MDAPWRRDALARMEAGNGLSEVPLGRVLRTDDDLPAGARLADAAAAGGKLGRVEAAPLRVRRRKICGGRCAAICAPVFARLVRFPREERQVRRLLCELGHCDR